jgi:hypothetical protein
MKKQRKYERKNLSQLLKVYDRSNDQFLGRLGNITPGGIMVFSESLIGTDMHMQLRIVFPHAVEGKEYLDVVARSVWIKRGAVPDYFDTGFELLEESVQHKNYIEKLIQEFGVE